MFWIIIHIHYFAQFQSSFFVFFFMYSLEIYDFLKVGENIYYLFIHSFTYHAFLIISAFYYLLT